MLWPMRPNDFPQPLATLMVATCNVLNLANPGRLFYENQDPYSQTEFDRKLTWLGDRFRMLNADVLAVQEVWDDAAFKGALGRSGLRYDFVAVPGAENDATHTGAQGTPRVGIATRLKVDALQSFAEFPPGFQVEIPGLGLHTRFERPPLVATLRMKHGQSLNVLTAHLKSKRPKFLQDDQGRPLEDPDDPNVAAVVVIGIEDGWTKKVVDGIAATGKPVVGFGIEGHGDHDTIMRASKAAKTMVQHATSLHRVECPISELWISTKCGESDTTSGCGANPTVGNAFDKLYGLGTTLVFGETSELTGGEHLVAARCRTEKVRTDFMKMFNDYQDMIKRHATTGVRASSCRSAEMSKLVSAPRCTPPMPPVANTRIPAMAAMIMVEATVVAPSPLFASTKGMSRRLHLVAA